MGVFVGCYAYRYMEDRLLTGVEGGFSVVAVCFLRDSVVMMIPWVLVMFAVVLCDLLSALRRCYLMGDGVRLSRAVRATMGKCVTYFSFVMMVCMLEVALGGGWSVVRWACLFVCLVEFSSIVGNLLRPHGYVVDFVRLLVFCVGRLFGRDVADGVSGIIRKGDDIGDVGGDSDGLVSTSVEG